MIERAASALAALAASCTPALAHVAPWSSADPPPLPVQFLVGIALMAVAGTAILWQGAALAREALARERERRRLRVMRLASTPRRPAPMCGRHVQTKPADAVVHCWQAARAPRRAGPMSALQAAVPAASRSEMPRRGYSV